MTRWRTGLWRGLALSTSTSMVALLASGAFSGALAASAAQMLSAPALAAASQALHTQTGGSPTSSAAVQAQIALSTANLTRAAQALSTMAASQQAANNAANALTNNGVPLSGLQCSPQCDPSSPGSTQPSDTTQWINLQAVQPGDRNTATQTLTIYQTAQNAVATWTKFNLYTGETLNFDQQGNSSWTVLNRVIDPSLAPSQIFGTINAPGSVYIINQNGIVFGGSAQINVHSLIASALDIGPPGDTVTQRNDFFLNTGIIDANNTTDQQVDFSYYQSNTSGPIEGGTVGVTVDAGATITASQNADGGGFVYLFAPNVTNAGTISTPAGETLMVAAQQISLTPNTYTPTTYITQKGGIAAANPISINGVGVQFSAAGSGVSLSPWRDDGTTADQIQTPGEVTNTGLIQADTGTVILNGDYVWQGGVIQADTSTSRSGAIFLDARLQTTLTAASATQILPYEDGGTIPFSAIGSFTPGSIEISGNSIDMEGLIEAPGASVAVTGNTNFGSISYPFNVVTLNPTQALTNLLTANGLTFAPSDPNVEARNFPRIDVGSAAVIDVSGLDGVTRSVADNFITVKPFGNEFADQPLQRDGALVGVPLTFDIRQSGTNSDGTTWVGSPLMDVSAYAGNVPQNINELLTIGGTVTLSVPQNFGGEVILQSGSIVNISGGYIQYTGAMVSSTNLITATGQVVNIADASPLNTYIGVAGVVTVDHARWGVSQTFVVPLLAGTDQFQPGYIEGRDAGGLSILNSSATILDGTVVAGVVAGQRQKALGQISTLASTNPLDLLPAQLGTAAGSTTVQFNPYAMPNAGYLAITGSGKTGDDLTVAANVAPQTASSFDVDTPLAGVNAQTDVLSAPVQLPASALGSLGQVSINMTGQAGLDGTIQVASGANLSVQPGGVIKLVGVSIAIDGSLTAHAGQISAEATGVVADSGLVFASSNLTVGANAVLDASGMWVNDAGMDTSNLTGGAYINGGSITLLTDNITVSTSQSTATNTVQADLTGNIVFNAITAADGSTQHSVLDVSSGGRITQSGGFQLGANGVPAGNGGNVTLETYVKNTYVTNTASGSTVILPTLAAPVATIEVQSIDAQGNATTNATLPDGYVEADGFAKGGSFAAQAAGIQIGGTQPAAAQNGTFYLPTSFFTGGGFSSYSLTAWANGLAVEADSAQGSTLRLEQQNYVAAPALTDLATGGNLSAVATLAYLPEIIRTPVNLTLAAYTEPYGLDSPGNPIVIPPPPQADVASAYPTLTRQPDLLIDSGVQIVADPGASIGMNIAGQAGNIYQPSGPNPDFLPTFSAQTGLALILGGITAPGGAINISQSTANGNSGDVEVWLGPHSRLDVSGTAIVDTRQDLYVAGQVIAGGTVTANLFTSQSALVAEPGAVIDVSGASGVFDIPQPGSGGTPLATTQRVPTAVWSDAGSITLATPTLLYAGSYLAQPGASQGNGGSLTLIPIGAVGAPGTLEIQQSGVIFPAGLQPNTGQTAGAIPSANTGLVYLTANQLTGSGIQNLSLSPVSVTAAAATTTAAAANGDSTTNTAYSPGNIVFTGNVDLAVTGNLQLDAAEITLGATGISGESGNNVTLQGNYVALRSAAVAPTAATLTALAALSPSANNTLTVVGNTIDIAGGVLNQVQTANFVAAGDIRLRVPYAVASAETLATTQGTDLSQFFGELLTGGNLTLTSAQIYPVSDVDFTLKSLGTNATITIASNGNAALAPLSAGGAVTLSATTIVQNGNLLAPLGIIRLGAQLTTDLSPNDLTPNSIVPTTSVTLGPGSVTSVSLNGLTVPYGETTDGTNWTYDSYTSSTTTYNPTQITPPAKEIVLTGASVNVTGGATVNLSGGGDIVASEFVPGTGGTYNVLSNGYSPNSYAIIPGYNPAVAPVDYDFVFAQGDTVPAIGRSVYLSGGDGLAAGYYTLLPAYYATLPGAYRVTWMGSGSTSQDALALNNRALQDGTLAMEGYFAQASVGTRDARTSLFDVQSNATWRQYSEIDETSGNAYFPAQAALASTATPPLPVDAGHLVLNPQTGLNLAGQFVMTAGSGGRDAEVDIEGLNLEVLTPGASPDAVLFAPQSSPQANAALAQAAAALGVTDYLGIDATQLTNMGTDSLLIGGVRSDTSTGVVITPTAQFVEVNNNASAPLAAAEVILVAAAKVTSDKVGSKTTTLDTAEGGVILAPASVIEAQGTLASSDPTSYTIATPATRTVVATTNTYTQTSSDSAVASVSNGATLTATLTVAQTSATDNATIKIQGGSITGGALSLYASGSINIASAATIQARNIIASSQAINLGGGSSASGFAIAPSTLSQFEQAQTLTFIAPAINFYSNVDLAMTPGGDLVLNTGMLSAQAGGLTDTISANEVEFENTSAAGTASAGTGMLNVNAGTIEFGGGNSGNSEALGSFGNADFTATQEIVTSGTGSFAAGGNLTFATPLFLVGAGSQQTITASGSVTLTNAGVGTGTPVTTAQLGGTLSITGSSITDNTLIQANAGAVDLEATSGNLQLGSSAVIDAAGYAQTFFDQIRIAGGGTVQLTADQGSLIAAPGASIDVASPAGFPGYAGQVALTAANGDLEFNAANAGGFGFDPAIFANPVAGDGGGTLTINVNTIAGNASAATFEALAVPSLFSNTVNIEVAQGSLTLGANLTAQNVTLTADQGTIRIGNTINASSTVTGVGGGTIQLYGGQGVTLAGGSLLATASDPNEQGGFVEIGTYIPTENGTINNGSAAPGYINLASGTIDVSNTANPANGGTVLLRAPLITASGAIVTSANSSANQDVAIEPVGATIKGASNITIDGFEVFTPENSTFDGIIDPAGAFTASGVAEPTGTVNTTHTTFYQTTLVNFVQDFSLADESNFSSLNQSVLQYQPGVDLVNDSKTANNGANVINNGNVTVASNWNLGAGVAGDLVTVSAITVGAKASIAVGTVVTNAQGGLLSVYGNYTGLDESYAAFTVAGGATVPAGAIITNVNGTLLSAYSNYTGFLENAAAITVAANSSIAVGTIITNASGKLLAPFTSYNTGLLENAAAVTVAANTSIAVGTIITNVSGGLLSAYGNYAGARENATAFEGTDGKTYPAGTVITNNNGVLQPPFTNYTGYETNATSFKATGGTLAADTLVTNGNGTVIAGYYENMSSFSATGGTLAAGTLVTNGSGTVIAGYYENMSSFSATGGTLAAGTVVTSANGAGYLENVTSFNATGGTLATAGTVVTDALGNVLPQYASYDPVLDVVISQLYYRTDNGSPTGVAPDITIRASGELYVDASITDGFFETENRFNTTYLTALATWVSTNSSNSSIALIDGPYILAGGLAGTTPPVAPYDPTGNGFSPTAAQIATSDLFPLVPVAGGYAAIDSSSYTLVGGANVASANPAALRPLSAVVNSAAPESNGAAGDVVITGDNSVTAKEAGTNTTITMHLPTYVRTGTGSITVAAARDLYLEDPTGADVDSLGVVYTAGRNSLAPPQPVYAAPDSSGNPNSYAVVTQNANGFLTPLLLACSADAAAYCDDGPLTAAAYPVDGGNLTVVAQLDIEGNEGAPKSGSTAVNPDQEFMAPWLVSQGTLLPNPSYGAFSPESASTTSGLKASIPAQTSWWINFGSFDQGVMSVGGNVLITAGRDINQLSVALPTTEWTSGGLNSTSVPVATLNNSGNMTVSAGRNILSGVYYEGSGTATITAGGAVQPNFTSNSESIATLLAVDTGSIALTARGSINIAGIVSGASLQSVSDSGVSTDASSVFISSYGQNSSVTLESVAASITTNSLTTNADILEHGDILTTGFQPGNFGGVGLYPASFEAAALLGSITVDSGFQLAPSNLGSLVLLAQTSLTTSGNSSHVNSNVSNSPDFDVMSTGPSLVAQSFNPDQPEANFSDLGTDLLHIGDTTPDLFYAVTGDITSTETTPSNSSTPAAPMAWEIDKPAQVHAGLDIVDLPFFGQNLAPTDVTSIIAGRDIYYTNNSEANMVARGSTGLDDAPVTPAAIQAGLSLAGPGFFDIEAGRNLGPFVTPDADIYGAAHSVLISGGNVVLNGITNTIGTGIITFGNTYAVGNRLMTSYYSNGSKANTFQTDQDFLLPSQGATIVADFGVGNGINYQGVINAYLNPNPPAGVIPAATNYLPQLQTFLQSLGEPVASPGAAWTAFNALSTALQHVFVDQIFVTELQNAIAASPPDYSLGYNIVDTLFPASDGYTDNGSGGTAAVPTVATGDLQMVHATIKTTEGGDVDILGPGGGMNVGSTATEINNRETKSPWLSASALGVMTLNSGSIYTFTDDNVLVDQSRVLTILGGNVTMWSSNGNLDAGRGKKTTVDYQPLTVAFSPFDYQTINAPGLVTGAGIGTIQGAPTTLPGSVYLGAPRGSINFGAAGVRATGNLTVAALTIVNAANASVTGTTTGVPQAPSINLGALESAGTTAGSATQAAQDLAAAAANRNVAPQPVPSQITVQVLGYGVCDAACAAAASSP